jgi:hypothetical protein
VRAAPGERTLIRLAPSRGTAITVRDIEMLAWIGRHGIVTPEQVARRFFTRDGGALGRGAAYRRLRKLRELGLVRSDRTFYMEPSVLRLTTGGARLADTGVGPARLVMAEIRHSLAIVDLIEQLLEKHRSATLTTERELRIERRQELAARTRRVGRGRLPDAILTINGKRVAVELDLTSKRSNDFDRILKKYLGEKYSEIWWYVKPRVVPRLVEIVRRNRADDLVTVRPWGN